MTHPLPYIYSHTATLCWPPTSSASSGTATSKPGGRSTASKPRGGGPSADRHSPQHSRTSAARASSGEPDGRCMRGESVWAKGGRSRGGYNEIKIVFREGGGTENIPQLAASPISFTQAHLHPPIRAPLPTPVAEYSPACSLQATVWRSIPLGALANPTRSSAR